MAEGKDIDKDADPAVLSKGLRELTRSYYGMNSLFCI
jgi:hypothetical protein